MRNFIQQTLFFILTLAGQFLSCQAQHADVRLNTDVTKARLAASLDKAIPQLLDSANIPGLSLAVIHNGQILYAQAYGVRQTETKEKVDIQTLFDAASLSKVVFAYTVLKFVDEELISLDKPLYQYLPYEDIKRDDRYKKITARMVLSHSTGFPNWRGGDSLQIHFEPGKQFQYSGEGFVYLQKVVEKLSGKSLQEVVEEKVFKPLGMAHSSYVWKKEFDANFATPHDGFRNPKFKNKPAQANAAYSLQTTALDYAAFITAILNEKGLKKQTVQDMLTSQMGVPEDESTPSVLSKSISWGLGVGLQETTDEKAFWHWGDNNTFKCYVAAYKKEKIGVVYFTNGYNGLSIAKEILELTTGGKQPALAFLNYDTYKSPGVVFMKNVLSKGVQQAIKPFLNANNKSTLKENEMNRIGYQLLGMGKIQEAKEVFRLNMEAYPQSADVYDSYAEAFLVNGEYKQATQYYQKSLELNPQNTTAKRLVNQLNSSISEKYNTTVKLKGYPDAKLITLVGTFNGWNHLHTLLFKKGDEWVAHLNLAPGKYQYKFVVDGKWILDPVNSATAEENGNTNSLLVIEKAKL